MPFFQNILILVAMEVEAKAIVKKLNLVPINGCFDPDLPFQAHQSTDATPLKITLVSSGKCKNFKVDRIGKEAAVLLAWESIKIFKPDLIINAGTAGGFIQKGANIGDVYLGSLIKYHDRLFHPIDEVVELCSMHSANSVPLSFSLAFTDFWFFMTYPLIHLLHL